MNKHLETLYIKIYISRQYSRLQSLNDSSSPVQHGDYISGLSEIYAALRSLSLTHGNRVKGAYAAHAVLFSDLELAIAQRDVDRMPALSRNLEAFLNEVYNGLSGKRSFKKIRPVLAIIAGILCLALLASLYAPLKRIFLTERENYDMVAHEAIYQETTLKDIFALRDALQEYYEENKSYPKSSGGWDGIIAPFGQAKKDWIPGLAPKYISELPRDPRSSSDPMKQYMYKSNGTDFKLIAHYPVGMKQISSAHPEMVDARRNSWAIGVWTKAAAGW
jgi:hypothetical protein